MADSLLTSATEPATPIELVRTGDFEAWLAEKTAQAQSWLQRNQFSGEANQITWLPDDDGNPVQVAVGWNGNNDLATLGSLPFGLPMGVYRLTSTVTELQLLGWALGAYQFNRYKAPDRAPAQLLLGPGDNADRLTNAEAAITLTRDLINTPAGDMLPGALAEEAQQIADAHSASCRITVGDDLLAQNFNAIHAVGRASVDEPRLIDINWGHEDHCND